jgi:sigma-B regulation protein RsbU (phosphoserine phosphatase)
MDAGTFGMCETCHDTIESDRLLVDPLCRTCLDHLSTAERRALEMDLDLAGQVQRGLLPGREFTIGGWELAYAYEPAGAVSGDYCDLIAHDDGGLFMVGDVTGKGVAASMLMAQLHAIFRSLVTVTRSVSDLVVKANRVFCQANPASRFATLVCGRLSTQGDVDICNAGHCLPLHVGQTGVRRVASTGLPVGLVPDGDYPCQHLRLASGDSLVLYTDGLSESFSAQGEQYGVERLEALLQGRRDLAAAELLAVVLADVVAFRAAAAATDDLTLLILRHLPD